MMVVALVGKDIYMKMSRLQSPARIALTLTAAGLLGMSPVPTTEPDRAPARLPSAAPPTTLPTTLPGQGSIKEIVPGDWLQVSVFELETQGKFYTGKDQVDAKGNLHLPVIGQISVRGLTPRAIEDCFNFFLALGLQL
jgi:protein involved in polysaccharide export with SLBB domain